MNAPAAGGRAAMRDRLLFALALAAGAAGWLAFAAGHPQADAFDRPLYWLLGLPAAALALAGLGYAGARGAWRWPFVFAGGQLGTALLLRGGDPGNLLPLTVALFGTLAAVGLVPTYLGVGVRRIVEHGRASRRDHDERVRAFADAARRAGGAGGAGDAGT